jgi:hypothetical protein
VQITIVAGLFRTFIDVWNGKDFEGFRKLINRARYLFAILCKFNSIRTFHIHCKNWLVEMTNFLGCNHWQLVILTNCLIT